MLLLNCKYDLDWSYEGCSDSTNTYVKVIHMQKGKHRQYLSFALAINIGWVCTYLNLKRKFERVVKNCNSKLGNKNYFISCATSSFDGTLWTQAKKILLSIYCSQNVCVTSELLKETWRDMTFPLTSKQKHQALIRTSAAYAKPQQHKTSR